MSGDFHMNQGCRGTACRALFILLLFLITPLLLTAEETAESDKYLLYKSIQDAFNSGDFIHLKDRSGYKVSINFEPPFKLNGYLHIDKFIESFNRMFSQYETNRIQWSSMYLETEFAVQSLNLILKNTKSERTVNYKFIFFLRKVITTEKENVTKEWEIYYLRGLKI